jgi:hypothetical protein
MYFERGSHRTLLIRGSAPSWPTPMPWTREIRVPDDVFAVIRSLFDERAIVELTATVAAYNMVSRFLEALQIHGCDAVGPAAAGEHEDSHAET